MKTVFLLFDSLNRRMLNSYGGEYIETPNFNRLAKKSVQFNNHYVGSMPCMPARRDMHSGRLSFLHRTWGPLEPFDNSFPELLRLNDKNKFKIYKEMMMNVINQYDPPKELLKNYFEEE